MLGDSDASQWIALATPHPAATLSDQDLGIHALIQMHSDPSKALPVDASSSQLQFKGKAKELTIALMSSPNDHRLLLKRGTELLKQGKPDLAIRDFTSVLNIVPNSLKATFNRAVARRQTGDLQGSLSDYNSVIKLTPKDKDAYRNRGIVKQMIGSQSGACADWGTAVALGDKEVGPWINEECR